MYYNTIITLLFLGNILPEPLDNYSIIIIPISRESRTNPREIQMKPRLNQDRIDIEEYEEPTELPNIDNFDFSQDRKIRNTYQQRATKDVLRKRETQDRLDRNNVIRYLIGRSDNSKHYKNDDEDENNDYNNKKARTLELYDMPMSFDYENQYGENKIVGGQEVEINLYPYHVAYGTNCGGAIIDKRWVITAGHCGKKPYIRVGSKYVNQGAKIAVKHSYIHPEWPAKSKEHPFDYDFQLLELEEELKFGDNIQPIKIAHIEDMVIGKIITVTGWGNTKENGPYSSVLRAVRVPIISKENCQHVPFPYFRGGLTARMFCAGYSEGKKDACQGDSGGPGVSYDRLLGMVSFGYGCATPGSFGVYSKVAKVRPWIEEVTGLNILGGKDVKISDAPYQANYADKCGAVIIHLRWALTTAHCGPEGTFIRVGSRHRLRGQKVQVSSHFIHPKYQLHHEFDYDVQLLKLFKELSFGKYVMSIKICKRRCGGALKVLGWGYSEEKGEYNDYLQGIKVALVSKDVCQSVNLHWYNHTLTNNMFCAGGRGKDACQGDSGGAATCSSQLVGLSSFGYGCGRDFPGVYVNLTHSEVRDWIRTKTGV